MDGVVFSMNGLGPPVYLKKGTIIPHTIHIMCITVLLLDTSPGTSPSQI